MGDASLASSPPPPGFSDTFSAASLAATFSGAYAPAPFTGSGMGANHVPGKALLSQFDDGGIVYTPPTFSDHLGVVCDFELEGGGVVKKR